MAQADITKAPSEQKIAQSSSHDGDSHDFRPLYDQVMQMQDRSDPSRLQKDMQQLSLDLHQQGILPGIDLTGTDGRGHFTGTMNGQNVNVVASDVRDVFQPGQANSVMGGVGNVASELYAGIVDEVSNHKGRLAMDAGIGLASGLVIGLAASPAIGMAVMALGLGYGGYQIAKHLSSWWHSASVTANPGLYSPTEVQQANKGVQDFGAGALDIGVGVAAGMAGGYAGRSIRMAIKGGSITPVTDNSQTATNQTPDSSQAANGQTPDASHAAAAGQPDASHVAGAAQSPDASHHSVVQAVTGADNQPNGAPVEVIDSPQTVAAGDGGPKPGDLREITDVQKFTNEFDKLWSAHQAGEKVQFQIDMSKPITTAEGNPMYLTADGQMVAKASINGADVYTSADGQLLNLTDKQIAGMKLASQGNTLGNLLAEADPTNWHPNLVKPAPGLEPPPPEIKFSGVQPAATQISNDGAPLDLSRSISVQDKMPIFDSAGKPVMTADGLQATTNEIPAGSRLSFGTRYNGGTIESIDPKGSVWATTRDGNIIRVTMPGESRTGFDATNFVTNEKGMFGQPVDGKYVVVRNGGSVLPDGQHTLDAYPNSLNDINRNLVLQQPEGSTLGTMVQKPIVSPHYDVPDGMAVNITMKDGGTQIASGAPWGDTKGFLWNPDSGYPNWEKVVAQTGVPKLTDGTLDEHTARLVVAMRGWNTQAGNALKALQGA